jgi:hypothetical protein
MNYVVDLRIPWYTQVQPYAEVIDCSVMIVGRLVGGGGGGLYKEMK